jgi:hypothetical protein
MSNVEATVRFGAELVTGHGGHRRDCGLLG